MTPTKRNAAKCRQCGDIVVSRYRHDFVYCKCGAIFVDGGNDYHRMGASNLEDILEVSDEELDAVEG